MRKTYHVNIYCVVLLSQYKPVAEFIMSVVGEFVRIISRKEYNSMGVLVSIMEYRQRKLQEQNEREYKEFMQILQQVINEGGFNQ